MLILILQCFSTFNFTVPFLSYLSVVLLVAVTVVLYWVPVRYLIMAWGVNKFARKLIRPHTIPNNEVLDLLSRVPTNEDLVSWVLEMQSSQQTVCFFDNNFVNIKCIESAMSQKKRNSCEHSPSLFTVVQQVGHRCQQYTQK